MLGLCTRASEQPTGQSGGAARCVRRRHGATGNGFIDDWLRLVVQFGLDGWSYGSRGCGTIAIFGERFAGENEVVFLGAAVGWTGRTWFATVGAAMFEARLAAASVVAAIWRATAITAIVAIAVAAARIVTALVALRRSIFGWGKIASAGCAWAGAATTTAATTATASTATAEASASTAVTATIAATVTTAVAFGATKVLAAAIVARAAIVTLRIFLRRIVMRREILRSRGVGFGLALFELVVRLGFGCGVTIGAARVARFDVAEVVVLVVMFLLVMLFAMLLVRSAGVSFVFVVMLVGLVCIGSAADGFAGQNFGGDSRRGMCRSSGVRIAVPVAVIVIFEIFENVADVKKRVAIEADIDERGLHTGEDASDAALVDATNQRELFFALDVNFD